MAVKNPIQTIDNQTEAWFENLIATLKTHQVMLETETADKGLEGFYATLIGGQTLEIASQGKAFSQQIFIQHIIVDYVTFIKEVRPKKLAFDFNDSEVLVWAEIEDNSEQQEKQLYLAEAKINAKYHKYGFDMTTMVVEESDHLDIPNHYKVLLNQR